ncbi:hypothetical protein BDZ91DRAFT_309194 [Kalaharituber pfeilii]|nr:hypothetical protein BDZ91DRAFT_309194 [Kalaharituber pfeilii]
MVFKPFANLARQGITKHLVSGGYAQSVIAASQSLPIIKAHANSHPRASNGFGSSSASSRTHSTQATQSTDHLNAYYPSHGQQFDDALDKDAKRYLFSKKILWSKAQHQTKDLHIAVEADASESTQLSVPSPVETRDAETVAELSNALEKPTEAATQQTADESTSSSAELSENAERDKSPVAQFNDDLEKLKRQGRFKDITVLFDHMLKSGLEPNTDTFNSLLSAIAQLIRLGVLDSRITHLLDVYSDLLRRKLTPNTRTYSILLTSLVRCAQNKYTSQELKQKEVSRFGFVLPSQETILPSTVDEGDGLQIALDLFHASTYVVKDRAYGVDVYNALISACSQRGLTDEMVKVYTQMEASGVKPNREIHLALMDGFGKAKDLHSVLEVYEEVKTALEQSKPITQEEKDRLYKHLVLAYVTADKSNVITEGFVEGFLESGELNQAMDWIQQFRDVNDAFSCYWTMMTLAKASDAGNFQIADSAYRNLQVILKSMESEGQDREMDWSPKAEDLMDAKVAFLALCCRSQNLERARDVWKELLLSTNKFHLELGATIAYVKLLFDNGYAAEALQNVANMISGFESTPHANLSSWNVAAGWRNILDFLSSRNLLTPEVAGEIWKVGGYTAEGPLPADCIKSLIAAFSTRPLLELTWSQLDILVQLNAFNLLAELPSRSTFEDYHRFEQTVAMAMRTLPLDGFTTESVSRAISIHGSSLHPEFIQSWHEHLAAQTVRQPHHMHPIVVPDDTLASPTLIPSEGSVEEQDPHWQKIDIRASNSVDAMIDKKKGLQDIMRAFRNAKDSGRILKYQTIARLIGHANREKNKEICNEIFATAKKDIPILADYSSVRFGWCYIYDAMIAACLNFGEHQLAASYRDEMAQIGGVPSANTYGLFIVNLKQSHETFDEASEAVNIFEQAKAQNVYPTPFLYNAVIGKLARARRVDDCLYYYSEMRGLGLKPTSVTYGTMINALCRVSDERYAEELFQEMEAMPNYRPRAAPYNSMIQFFATTKRDRAKVLQYYNRMLSVGIKPTGHTYKLLIDAYASLDPPDIDAAQSILDMMKMKNEHIECTHHASMIHAKGCVLHDIEGSMSYFRKVTANPSIKPDAILYQALFEALVANHRVLDTPKYLREMKARGVEMTPYIANTLIHGWALEKNIEKAKSIYDALNPSDSTPLRREPSTYEAMTRAYLAVEDRKGAMDVVNEMLSRGYPAAVMGRILDLVKGGGIFQTVVG